MFLSRLFLRLWLLDESTVSYIILQTYFLKKNAALFNIQLMKVVNFYFHPRIDTYLIYIGRCSFCFVLLLLWIYRQQ